MKNLKRNLSLFMAIVLVVVLCISLVSCVKPEKETYYITNTTDMTFRITLVKNVKNLDEWNDVKPGDTIEFNVEITKDVNILKIFYAGIAYGRISLYPEDGYVDGGHYNIVPLKTGDSAKDSYILVPADEPYVPAQ